MQQAPGTPRRTTPRKVSSQWSSEAEPTSAPLEVQKDEIAPQSSTEEPADQKDREHPQATEDSHLTAVSTETQVPPVSESAVKFVPSPKQSGKRMLLFSPLLLISPL